MEIAKVYVARKGSSQHKRHVELIQETLAYYRADLTSALLYLRDFLRKSPLRLS